MYTYIHVYIYTYVHYYSQKATLAEEGVASRLQGSAALPESRELARLKDLEGTRIVMRIMILMIMIMIVARVIMNSNIENREALV